MIIMMDACELYHYKELTLNERINDKQEQLEHLAKLGTEDGHGWIGGYNMFTKVLRLELLELLK